MARQIDLLGDLQLALLHWALLVYIRQQFTQILRSFDQGDQPILDTETHISTILHSLSEVADGVYREGFTTSRAVRAAHFTSKGRIPTVSVDSVLG